MITMITYNRRSDIKVGVPFTWGTGSRWAIKVYTGVAYFLDDGTQVKTTEAEMLEDGLYYAKSLSLVV